ncbi:MAG TPA: hypothetical protein VL092_05625 [Chitinophagaceae bacterium]|nr:hypothetical protein [Chitinophagaceae bacterium]
MKQGLFILFAIVQLVANGQSLKLRNDGFYFFDNNVDTLYLLKGDKKNEAQLKSELEKNKFKISGVSDCVPKNGIPLDGSSHLQLLSFFTADKGTYISMNCWTKNNYKEYLAILQRRHKGRNLTGNDLERIFTVAYLPNNMFVIKFGLSEHNSITFNGQIFKDKIIVTQIYPTFRGGFTPPPGKQKTFKFYPTGTLPPFRDKFVIQYKNPF